MFLGLSLFGYEVEAVNINVVKEEIIYDAIVNIAEFSKNTKRSRRKK